MKIVAKCSAFASLSYQVHVKVCNPIPLNIHFDWLSGTKSGIPCVFSLVFIVLNVRGVTKSKYPSLVFWVYKHCNSKLKKTFVEP